MKNKALLFLLSAAAVSASLTKSAQAQINAADNVAYFFTTQAAGAVQGYQQEVAIDLGNSASSLSYNISFSDINAVLQPIYGANWDVNSNLNMGIMATTSAGMVNSSGLVNTKYTADTLQRINQNNQQIVQGFNASGVNGSVNNSLGNSLYYAVLSTTSGRGAVANYQLADDPSLGVNFGQISGQVSSLLGQNGSDPTLSNEMYFWQTGLKGLDIGTAGIDGSGNIAVNLNAVPEPQTYALFGFAALILVVLYRRKTA
jgi:hypothetical protein